MGGWSKRALPIFQMWKRPICHDVSNNEVGENGGDGNGLDPDRRAAFATVGVGPALYRAAGNSEHAARIWRRKVEFTHVYLWGYRHMIVGIFTLMAHEAVRSFIGPRRKRTIAWRTLGAPHTSAPISGRWYCLDGRGRYQCHVDLFKLWRITTPIYTKVPLNDVRKN